MHVLITADTVGGVWTYTRELVTGLAGRGVRVTLVSLGAIPRASDTAWMDSLSSLDYRPTAFRLEWMQDSDSDIEQSSRYIENLIREVQPDLLHFNQYCYGSLPVAVPRVVVAHSDVVSWWVGVHGHEPPESMWIRQYRETVLRGLRGADVVVAPSNWMLSQIKRYYGAVARGQVIHNGCDPVQFDANRAKENCVLAAGRVWDSAKGISILLEREHPVPVWLAGSEEEPGGASKTNFTPAANATFLGYQRPNRMRSLFARAGTFASPAVYEPFGLAPLEAAFSRCALVASDIPALEEVWEGAPIYFRSKDAGDLARSIQLVTGDTEVRSQTAERAYERANEKFTAERMVSEYEQLYQVLVAGVKA